MYRYRAVLLRARFDENKDIKDMRVAQQLLDEGEKELFSVIHYQPRQCEYSLIVYIVPIDWDDSYLTSAEQTVDAIMIPLLELSYLLFIIVILI